LEKCTTMRPEFRTDYRFRAAAVADLVAVMQQGAKSGAAGLTVAQFAPWCGHCRDQIHASNQAVVLFAVLHNVAFVFVDGARDGERMLSYASTSPLVDRGFPMYGFVAPDGQTTKHKGGRDFRALSAAFLQWRPAVASNRPSAATVLATAQAVRNQRLGRA
jgi:hypothetical protein